MSDHSKWIEAATVLIDNPRSLVLCPSCGLAYLSVEDEQVDDKHIDRHLKCPECGAQETVLKRVGKGKSSTAPEDKS